MTTLVLKADSAVDLKPFKALAQKIGLFAEYVKEETAAKRTNPAKTENYRGRGCMKGKIWMSPDFDAPLEEFKDYM